MRIRRAFKPVARPHKIFGQIQFVVLLGASGESIGVRSPLVFELLDVLAEGGNGDAAKLDESGVDEHMSPWRHAISRWSGFTCSTLAASSFWLFAGLLEGTT